MNGDRGWKHATVSLQGGQKNSDQVLRAFIAKAKLKWCDIPRERGTTRQPMCPFL